MSGEVVAVNGDLANHPEAVNKKPHEAWMIRLRPAATADVEALLDASAYSQLVKE